MGPTRATGAFLALVVATTGCTRRAADTRLPLDFPPPFSASGAVEVPDRWWMAFGDGDLNGLVDEALRSSFDLEAAWQRLREARAIARREGAPLLPGVEAFLEGGVSRGDEPGAATADWLRLGLAAEYEVDLWGRVRSRVRAERHRARATFADYQAAAVTVAAEVARTWYQLVEARSQLELLGEQIETNEKLLRLIEARFGLGQARSADVLRQRQLLESTREQTYPVEASVRVLEHQLAVLLGRPPQGGHSYERRRLASLPPPPSTGLPGELVLRRPDVRGAYERLRAADGDLAAAIRDRYPRLTLNASAATRAADPLGGWMRSFLGNLVGPLLDAEGRAAEVDRTEAVKWRRLQEYARAILTAFQEVEDALVREGMQLERIRSLESQADLAGRAYERLRAEYLAGVGDYLEVLTALAGDQQLRRDLLSARRILIELRISLYRALAGGFETGRETLERT